MKLFIKKVFSVLMILLVLGVFSASSHTYFASSYTEIEEHKITPLHDSEDKDDFFV